MDYAQQQRNPGRHLTGMMVVVLLHIALGWALVTGLARQVIEVIKAPIETKIIDEVKPPPPPPPDNLPPPPKTAPPPPSFVPPPEIDVKPPPAPAPVITTTPVVPPPAPPVTIAPPPAPVVTPPAPAPAAPLRVAPKVNFSACEKPEYPRQARAANAEGLVVVIYTMDVNGVISDAKIEKSSGVSREHRMLDRATLDAVMACKGTPGTIDGKAEKLTGRIEYNWTLTQ